MSVKFLAIRDETGKVLIEIHDTANLMQEPMTPEESHLVIVTLADQIRSFHMATNGPSVTVAENKRLKDRIKELAADA